MTNAERNKKYKLRRIEMYGRKAYNRYHNNNYAVKKRILKDRTHGYCNICRKLFPRDLLTIDHIIQFMNGGTNEKSNLQLACKFCQQEKDVKELQKKQLEKGLIKNPELIKSIKSMI